MEKFGVEEDEKKVKTAEEQPEIICPLCQSLVRPVEETGVLVCPNCGTRAWESPP